MSLVDLSDLSTGAPNAFGQHAQPGTSVTGTITYAEKRQVTDFQTGAPQTWQNGDPQMQLKIIIDTGQPDPTNDNNPEKAVYIKLWGQQKKALLDALGKAGTTDLQVGGIFAASYTGDGQATQRGFNPPKLYTYNYTPPVQSVSINGGSEQADPHTGEVSPTPQAQAQTAAQPAPAQQPAAQTAPAQQPAAQPAAPQAAPQAAQQPAAAPAGGGVDAEQVKTLINAGVQDAQIAAATGADLTVIAAIRNTL